MFSCCINKSSKKASKRGTKQQRAAIVASNQDQNGLRIMDEIENCTSTPTINEENIQSMNEVARKKKRGPTELKQVSENFQKMELTFNELGQVVDVNSDKFASIIGAMVREHIPVVIKDWPSVDDNKRAELWSFTQVYLLTMNIFLLCFYQVFICIYVKIQQRFIISDCHQKITFQHMGNYWKTFKSRLRTKIRIAAKSKTLSIDSLRPKNVTCHEARKFFVKET